MTISPVSGNTSSASIQAQVQLQNKATDQQEAVVSKIMQGTEESAAKIAATGKRTIAVA